VCHFNAQTTISYQLSKPAWININIFNVHGALVRNLRDEYQISGNYRIPWDGNNSNGLPVPSGTYLGRVVINDIQQTIRMSLIN
jgi:flagellar hook assembly protein FlgD